MDIKTVKLVASDSYLAPYYAATNYIEDTRSINPTPKSLVGNINGALNQVNNWMITYEEVS